MKITVDEDGSLVIGEVFSGAFIETAEGNRMGFCLRDDTIEFNVLPKGIKKGDLRWFRVNMQTRDVDEMELARAAQERQECREKAIDLTNAIIADLRSHHIQFDGKLTHTGRDTLAEEIVEPFLRALAEPKNGGGGSG